MPRQRVVDEWFARYENPHKEAMLLVRSFILETDPRVDETIKWQTPTFTYEGNIASFNPRSEDHVSLLFHTGAAIPGKHPLLAGGGETARYMSFASLSEVRAAKKGLQDVVRAWIGSRATKSATPAAKMPQRANPTKPKHARGSRTAR